jgi:hypothetical protein
VLARKKDNRSQVVDFFGTGDINHCSTDDQIVAFKGPHFDKFRKKSKAQLFVDAVEQGEEHCEYYTEKWNDHEARRKRKIFMAARASDNKSPSRSYSNTVPAISPTPLEQFEPC